MADYGINILLTISSIIVSVFVAMGNTTSAYSLLFLLPLTYAVCVFVSFRTIKQATTSVVYATFVFGAFARMVVSPLLMKLSDYYIHFGYYAIYLSTAEVEKTMPQTCALMCYENICLFIALNYFFSDKRVWPTADRQIRIINGKYIYRASIIIMLIVVLTSLLRYPTFRNYVGFVWKNSLAQLSGVNIRGDSSSVVYRLFIWFVDILQLLLPVSFTIIIKNLRVSEAIKTTLFMGVSFLTLVIMTENKIFSIMYSILLIFWYYKDRGGIPKKWFVVIGAIGIFAIMALLEKNLYTLGLSSNRLGILSGTVNSYFSGPFNVAASLLISRDGYIKVLLGDILNSIPFLPVFFKNMPTTRRLFNYLIKGSGAIETKVIPLIGQGSFYLSPLFAPLFTIIVVYFARKWEIKAKRTSNSVDSFLYLVMALFAALSPCVFNGTVLFKNICNIYIIRMLVLLRGKELTESTPNNI